MDWTKDNDINFKIIYFLQNKQDLQQLTTIDTKSRKMRNFFNECNKNDCTLTLVEIIKDFQLN